MLPLLENGPIKTGPIKMEPDRTKKLTEICFTGSDQPVTKIMDK